MSWYGENGLKVYCDNGLIAEQDDCPCGCSQCYQPDNLIITVTNAQPPNAGANGIYVIGRYMGEPLYNNTVFSPYTFPYNDYTYVLLTDNLMFYLQCQPDFTIDYTNWDDGYPVGPRKSGTLNECFRYTFDYAWGFWSGQINVEPVFL